MTHLGFGVLGVVVAVIGLGLVVFNKQYARMVPLHRGPVAKLPLFRPGPTGRVPAVTIIGIGWIVFGLVAIFVAVTRQPL